MRTLAPTSCLLLATATAVLAQAPDRLPGSDPQFVPTPYDRDALYPTPVTIYGRVNAGLRQRDPTPQQIDRDPCATPGAPAASRRGVDAVERNRIGLRGTEVLDRGTLAHFHLEQSFDLDTGALRGSCGAAFDARATVGLSDRAWGRVDLGRTDQVAWLLALRADPWGGNGTASPDWRTYVAPERGAARSSGAVTYNSPAEWPVRAAVQLGRPLPSQPGRHGGGFSLAWDRLPWLVGAGGQRWPGGDWALPVVALHDSGTHRAGAALTWGRTAGTHYHNLFIGFSTPRMSKGEPGREEWRLGLNLHRVDGGGVGDWRSDTKLGLGWRYRYSRQAWVAVGGGWVKPQGGSARGVADISLSYAFERHLRVPQWPR